MDETDRLEAYTRLSAQIEKKRQELAAISGDPSKRGEQKRIMQEQVDLLRQRYSLPGKRQDGA